MRKIYDISFKDRTLRLGEKTIIMGVVNVTPDSFSDKGMFFDHSKAADQAFRLINEGADIIDIGGESTRPFSDPVSEKEEMRRVLPVIEKIASNTDVIISVDTRKAKVAQQAVEAGALMINDISGLSHDPKMAETAAKSGAALVIMHMIKTPKTMQIAPFYNDLIGEVRAFLKSASYTAVNCGVDKSKIIIDPGIGFGKTLEHNFELIAKLCEFKELDSPILVGPSRKAFIRHTLKKEHEKDIDPMSLEVKAGTQAAVAASIMAGAHIIRVHDAAKTLLTAKIIDEVCRFC